MAKTVYIAGKISGDPNYKEKFNTVQKILEAKGWIVLNPAWLPSEGFEYEAYMRMSMAMLIECDAVCFLPDWKESKGAAQEISIARELEKDVWFREEVHSEWYNKLAGYRFQDDKSMHLWTCKNCGFAVNHKGFVYRREMLNYCPNCGAKMDGDKNAGMS